MKILNSLDDIPEGRYTASLGIFDGVHRGHRYIISQLKKHAKEANSKVMLVTFTPHPQKVMAPESKLSLLTTREEKLSLLQHEGVDVVYEIPFTKELAKLKAEEFISKFLTGGKAEIIKLALGYDQKFGSERRTDFDFYRQLGDQFNIGVVQLDKTTEEGVPPSSSTIREALLAGDLVLAEHLLGYKYQVSGMVKEGHKLGRKIGFPTANISANHPDKLFPKQGAYAALVVCPKSGKQYKAMVNLGVRPTLENSDKVLTLEAHIFDYSGELYGEHLDVAFVRYLREEKRFDSIEVLKKQLGEDAKLAKEYLQ